MLAPTYVVSSNIDAVGYRLGKLYIRFKSGGAYSYDRVPFDCFDVLQKGIESPGRYFHRFIKDKFHHTKLDVDPFI